MVASINVGCRVVGNFGPFLPAACNPDGTQVKRRKRQQLEGVIVEARGEKRWLVRFTNGLEKECASVGLKLLFDPRYRSGAAAVTQLPSEPSAAAAAAAPPTVPEEPTNSAVAPPNVPEEPSSAAAPPTVPEEPTNSAAAPPNVPEEPSSATAPSITPQAPLLSETAQPNGVSSAEETLLAADFDVDEMEEEIQEGTLEEDVGFDVVENITSDVYQQKRQECEQKKLELIESSYSITCKSGGNELVWSVVPDSIPESPPIEFQNIGIREMDWDNFNKLSSYAKALKKTN
jgi:hypothetical protein